MFISGTGPIRQGLAEKRAGNLNFKGGATMYQLQFWSECCPFFWLPGGDHVLPVGDKVLPGCDQLCFWRYKNGKKSVLAWQ